MSRILNVEVCEDGKIFISEESTSGACYDGSSPTDVGFAVQCYLEDYSEN